MPLFTVFLEFGGGTYVSQFRSSSPRSVAKKYAAQLLINDALGTSTLRKRLATVVSRDTPVAISGIRNVWCCSASLGKKLALLNIVQTSDDSRL